MDLNQLKNGNFCKLLERFYSPYLPDRSTFDWIPLQTRILLVYLLDRWKAAEDRRAYNDEATSKLDEQERKVFLEKFGGPFHDEQEREDLFKLTFKQMYQVAAQRRQLDETRGVITPPELDMEFWQKACDWEMYKARRAAGEPVFFVDGKCCMDAQLCLGYELMCGPYPGLNHYCSHFGSDPVPIEFFRAVPNLKFDDYGKYLVPIEEDGDHALYGFNRADLFELGVIGPATYAERARYYDSRLSDVIPITYDPLTCKPHRCDASETGLTPHDYKRLADFNASVDLSKSIVLSNELAWALHRNCAMNASSIGAFLDSGIHKS